MADRHCQSRAGVRHILLQPHVLLQAYASGLFPMADEMGEMCWFSPDPRAVIFPDDCRLPAASDAFLRASPYVIRLDTAFERVIAACRERPEGSWISRDVLDGYCGLRDLGFAHSVEAWRGEELVGGLYGVAIGSVFFGESMFHRASGASKHALLWLIERCRQAGYRMLDVQWLTPHLKLYGAAEISRGQYLRRLGAALERPACFLRRQEVPADWVTWWRQANEVELERRLGERCLK
jgi:leucyl/phenylalanyl-tRNA---protein transferase